MPQQSRLVVERGQQATGCNGHAQASTCRDQEHQRRERDGIGSTSITCRRDSADDGHGQQCHDHEQTPVSRRHGIYRCRAGHARRDAALGADDGRDSIADAANAVGEAGDARAEAIGPAPATAPARMQIALVRGEIKGARGHGTASDVDLVRSNPGAIRNATGDEREAVGGEA